MAGLVLKCPEESQPSPAVHAVQKLLFTETQNSLPGSNGEDSDHFVFADRAALHSPKWQGFSHGPAPGHDVRAAVESPEDQPQDDRADVPSHSCSLLTDDDRTS